MERELTYGSSGVHIYGKYSITIGGFGEKCTVQYSTIHQEEEEEEEQRRRSTTKPQKLHTMVCDTKNKSYKRKMFRPRVAEIASQLFLYVGP